MRVGGRRKRRREGESKLVSECGREEGEKEGGSECGREGER